MTETNLQESYQKAKDADQIVAIKRIKYARIVNWPTAIQNIVGMIFIFLMILMIGHCNHWWNVPYLVP